MKPTNDLPVFAGRRRAETRTERHRIELRRQIGRGPGQGRSGHHLAGEALDRSENASRVAGAARNRGDQSAGCSPWTRRRAGLAGRRPRSSGVPPCSCSRRRRTPGFPGSSETGPAWWSAASPTKDSSGEDESPLRRPRSPGGRCCLRDVPRIDLTLTREERTVRCLSELT